MSTIEFTTNQQEVIDKVREYLLKPKNERTNLILSGSGGTGKTTILCFLAAQLVKEDFKVCMTAMTGKATGVLRNKVLKVLRDIGGFDKIENLKVDTLTKVTKKSKVLALTESGDTLYTNEWLRPENAGYDLIIIDETSMVGHLFVEWLRRTNGLCVFAGDFCQIPEVNTPEVKREIAGFKNDLKYPDIKFVSGYGIKLLKECAHLHLTEVLRSIGPITKLCNSLRDFSMGRDEIKSIIKRYSKDYPEDIIYTTSTADIETSNDWQIIAYTNKLCQEINNKLCIGGEYPALTDKIILFDNLNPLSLYNGDTMMFGDLLNSIKGYNMRNSTRKIYVCMKWQGKMPSKVSSHRMEREFFKTYVAFKQAMDETNRRRLIALPSMLKSMGYAATTVETWIKDVKTIQEKHTDPGQAFIEIVTAFQDEDHNVAKYIMDNAEQLPRLYMVSCDYGYCVTTHKSQGSEYPNVCYILEKFDKPLLYTGISRAKDKVKVVDMTK